MPSKGPFGMGVTVVSTEAKRHQKKKKKTRLRPSDAHRIILRGGVRSHTKTATKEADSATNFILEQMDEDLDRLCADIVIIMKALGKVTVTDREVHAALRVRGKDIVI